MSTSDQEQAVDATPKKRGASRATEAAVPNQAPSRPTAERAPQAGGTEIAEAAEVAEAAEAAEDAKAAGAAEGDGPSTPSERPKSAQLADSVEDLNDPESSADPVDPADPADEPERHGMAPRQARRIRMVAAGVLMAAMGVILVVRLATRSSVLVVGVYGLALILCGVVIELSRNGRTRLGSWLLVVGLAAALGMDWFVLP
ncbi:DUF308 domain-containing protein [Streptomyces violascens]|uniref:DUF308 domain-containing protein n=1 Tax=Streptomyces violascens TaxID=67381 RepID=UPI0037B06FE5